MANAKKKLKITISVDDDIFQEMKKICESAGQKISSVINILIHKFVMDSREGNVRLLKKEEKKSE